MSNIGKTANIIIDGKGITAISKDGVDASAPNIIPDDKTSFFLDAKSGNAYFAGRIKAKSGDIGGWDIKGTALKKGGVGMSSDNSSLNNYAFWAGNTDPSQAKFWVKHDGTMKATKATIEGDLTATTGKIGNWTINNGAITNGTTSLNSDGSFKSGNFRVDANGNVYATNITATGGTFNDITVSGNSTFNGTVYASSGSFKGKVEATGGSFNGAIYAYSGNIGGWKINGHDGFTHDNASIRTNGSFAFYSQVKPGGGECIFDNGFRLHTTQQQRLYTPEGITIGAGVSSAPDTISRQLYLTGMKTGDGSSRNASGVQIYAGSGCSIRLNAEKNVWIRSGGSIGLEGEGAGIFIGDGTMGNSASKIKIGAAKTALYLKGQIYNNLSSRRVKQNIQPITDDEKEDLYNNIKNTTFYTYNYKKGYGDSGIRTYRGFIIEDLENTIVEQYLGFAQDEKDNNIKTFDTVALSQMNLILIHQLQKKIEILEKQIKKESN